MEEIQRDEYGRPRVFLEGDNVPVQELGVECQREGGAGLHPPVNRLHVWWARRPLTVSRAAILGSLLPERYDSNDFLELMGIPPSKDPVKAKKIIEEVKAGLRKRVSDPYGYDRAFKNELTASKISELHDVLAKTWNENDIVLLDSFAGGGSIPFEAKRLGLNVVMNELNPVASVIERATIEYPSLFGKELLDDIEKWGKKIEESIENQLSEYFPRNQGEKNLCYIWVRTVTCPHCELKVPLSPNFWLDKENNIGYKLVLPENGNECRFKIAKKSDDFDPGKGTESRGKGRCPRCGEVIEGKEIKRQAKNGDMDHQMACVGFKMEGRSGRHFREVTEMDLEGYKKAEQLIEKKLPKLKAKGLIPEEDYPQVTNDSRPHNYGMQQWYKFFNSRQLLVHTTTMEAILGKLGDEIRDGKKREALRVYMQLAFDKCIDYNSIQTRMHSTRTVMVNTFDRHDFSFKWSYGEIDGAGQLFRWAISQILDAYENLVELIGDAENNTKYYARDAANLIDIIDKSIDAVVIDPPYYDNVMYAECSDFFYVWMKRGLSDIFPELFSPELTNKEDEAVANRARFKDAARGKKKQLAEQDYEAKMAAAFREMHRVLRDDGVMTVMFTHKKTKAWNALARGLMDSGFEITSAWPIHTESQHSLHQAKKNAAASTILLTCRKRPEDNGTGWWEELRPQLEERVKEQAEIFEQQGISRLDLSIACFGTALETISEKWPVKRGDGTIISPEEALDAAREVVSQWFMDKITSGERKAVDPATQFYILAWYIFQARKFPYDEARKLSLSVGVSLDDLKRRKLWRKKGKYIMLRKPSDRTVQGGLKAGKKTNKWHIDYVHAAMLEYEEEGAQGLKRFHQNSDAMEQPGYRHAISYLLDVLPRTEEVTEYHTLESMWESTYHDVVDRKRPAKTVEGRQTRLDGV